MTEPTTITIDIVSDTVCPWCYVGKRRLERALAAKSEDIKVMVGWRPFQLNPEMPEDGMDRRDYLEAKFGGKEGAKKVYSAIEEAGKSEELDFDFSGMARQPNTINSHRLIDFAGKEGKQDQVVEALFQAYFLNGRDIGDVDELVSVAVDADLDETATRSYLESDEDVERIREEDAHARQMGVQGVPCFIINRKYAISGAQDPAVFLQAWEQIQNEMADGEPATAAE
jgi:predicted DsbA family dithiol-disulfide isomerase